MITVSTETNAFKPKGAPFIIDRCPFRYGEQIDVSVLNLDEDKIINWPMVYILANSDSAYVGQTTSVATRMSQHGANAEKKDFTTVNIIFNEEFNSSVVTDYEHRLIGYMHGDGRYVLTNKNDGMTDTNYFSKAQYSQMFNSLWDELRRLELVDHTLDEIEESEVFRYSPYKGLTADQRVALDKIMGAIEHGLDRAAPVVVEGMPGTGKTVLAIYLLKMLKDDPRYKDLNIKIVEPVTSLRNTLKSSLRGVSGLTADDIISPADLRKPEFGFKGQNEKSFDILLVDEAHRLKRRKNLGTQFRNYDLVNQSLGLDKEATQLEWILAQAKLPVFFYDSLQSIGPSCVTRKHIVKKLGGSLDQAISLDSQMRVKGGREYLHFVKDILDGGNPEAATFGDYEFVLHTDFGEFNQAFNADYEVHDLSRMVAGYAWKWKSRHDKNVPDISIDGVALRWNCTYDNWVGKGFDNPDIAHEVGCIHSIQGYDLSRAYVLIGNDIQLDAKTGLLRANKESYFDRNGSAAATPEELTRYIKNIYYVLLTRGIYGTHVYVADSELREYMQRFFVKVV